MYLSQFSTAIGPGARTATKASVIMEHELTNYDSSMSDGNVERLMKKTNKCNHCDYASSQVSHLRRHLKTHSGEKSNKCNQCDFASYEAGSLRAHLKIHSGEKSNKCNQCDFASSHASALMTHLKTHSGGKSN